MDLCFLCYFNIVIQSLGRLGKGDIHVNRQNKTIKKRKEIDGVVVCLSFCCQYGDVWQYKRRRIYL